MKCFRDSRCIRLNIGRAVAGLFSVSALVLPAAATSSAQAQQIQVSVAGHAVSKVPPSQVQSIRIQPPLHFPSEETGGSGINVAQTVFLQIPLLQAAQGPGIHTDVQKPVVSVAPVRAAAPSGFQGGGLYPGATKAAPAEGSPGVRAGYQDAAQDAPGATPQLLLRLGSGITPPTPRHPAGVQGIGSRTDEDKGDPPAQPSTVPGAVQRNPADPGVRDRDRIDRSVLVSQQGAVASEGRSGRAGNKQIPDEPGVISQTEPRSAALSEVKIGGTGASSPPPTQLPPPRSFQGSSVQANVDKPQHGAQSRLVPQGVQGSRMRSEPARESRYGTAQQVSEPTAVQRGTGRSRTADASAAVTILAMQGGSVSSGANKQVAPPASAGLRVPAGSQGGGYYGNAGKDRSQLPPHLRPRAFQGNPVHRVVDKPAPALLDCAVPQAFQGDPGAREISTPGDKTKAPPPGKDGAKTRPGTPPPLSD